MKIYEPAEGAVAAAPRTYRHRFGEALSKPSRAGVLAAFRDKAVLPDIVGAIASLIDPLIPARFHPLRTTFDGATSGSHSGDAAPPRHQGGNVNLQEANALVQIGANLAVVASVLFLVFQSRLGIQMLREAAERNHMDKHQSVSRLIAENPQLADLWARGSKAGIAKLTDTERVQFINFFTYVLRIWEELFLQHCRGLIDDVMWKANVRILRDTKEMPGAIDGWAVRRHLFTDAFQKFYDGQDSSQARPLYQADSPAAG